MKLLEEVKKIVEGYNLKPIELPEQYVNVYKYLKDHPEDEARFEPKMTEKELFQKYEKHVPRGWYGFAIGTPVIPEWYEIIDEILKLCIMHDPEFEIHQIKIKFGGIRFYCYSEVIEDETDIEIYITRTLHDKKLIY